VPWAGEEQAAERGRGLTSVADVRWRTTIEPNRDVGGYPIDVRNFSPPAERMGAESLVSTAGDRKALLETEIRCLVRTLLRRPGAGFVELPPDLW
jgi:hypothetical protein